MKINIFSTYNSSSKNNKKFDISSSNFSAFKITKSVYDSHYNAL